jgi:hypothetical protein
LTLIPSAGERRTGIVRILQHDDASRIKSIVHLDQLIETLQDLVMSSLKNGMKDKRQKRLTLYRQMHALEPTLARHGMD